MRTELDGERGDELANEMDRALRSFWRGSHGEIDRLVGEPGSSALMTCLAAVTGESAAIVPHVPRIAEYEIVREIGRGGMGVVYEARHARTQRRVALKVLRTIDSGGREGRLFAREVGSLARFKHPNIATLFDAGETPDGRSYFAMELVEGVTLAEWARKREAFGGTREGADRRRLELFGRICAAVNYAHQRGVIHRDLKPSNILVDANDQPKVLDFGMARLLDADAELATQTMEMKNIVGTLAYMSPEQAMGRLDDVDIRTDVYALGVILYELLTGRRPYEVRDSALAAGLAAIAETPPRRPSVVNAAARGDLEAIVLKALEKSPDRRYASAAEFGEDVERYLGSRPIRARRPSVGYLLAKLVGRHRLTAALIGVLAILAAGSGVVFVMQAAAVRRQRDEAKAQTRRAERISGYLTGMFGTLDPKRLGPSVPVRSVLDQASGSLESELADDRATQAAVHDVLGRGYMGLGVLNEAERHLKAALDLRREVFGERSGPYATSLHQLGLLAVRQQRPDDWKRLLTEAYEIRRELFGDESADVAESLDALGRRFSSGTEMADAEQMQRRALEIRRKIGTDELSIAQSLSGLGVLLVAAGRYEEAEPILVEALGIQRRMLGPSHFDVARTLTDLGEIYFYWGQYDKAEECHREQVRILRKLFPQGQVDLAFALSDLGGILGLKGEYREAEQLMREGIEMEGRCGDEPHPALCTNNYAKFLRSQGRYAEAEPLARSVYDWWHGNALEAHRAKSYACQHLGLILLDRGEVDEADRLFRAAEENWRALFGETHPRLAVALIGEGRVAELRGQTAEAVRFFGAAVEIRRKRIGDDHPETAEARIELARAMAAAGQRVQAAATARAALALLRSRMGEKSADVSWGMYELAGMVEAAEAEQLLRGSIAIERGLDRERHPQLGLSLSRLGEVLAARGELADACSAVAEAVEILKSRLSASDTRLMKAEKALYYCSSKSQPQSYIRSIR